VRPASETLAGVLTSDFDHHFEFDLYYAQERRLQGVLAEDVKFNEDGDAAIQQSGNMTVVWTDTFAQSLSPTKVSDVLAPFGPEVYLYSVVSAGRFSERVALGQYVLTEVPSAQDEELLFRDTWVTVGSTVELEFKERTAAIQRDRFDVPTAATDLSSVWNELARLTKQQIIRTVADRAIPRSVVYEEDRLDAVYALADVLDAIPHMTADGAMSLRPKSWPQPVATLRRGAGGSLLSVGRSMSPDKVYNRVAFRGKSNDQEVILASAEITSGPLRTRNPDGSPSPFGVKTYFAASDYVTNRQQAQEYVDRELPRVSSFGSVVIPVKETFNPLRERGDVVRIEQVTGLLVGRILTISRGADATQDLTVEVLVNG
jgi:hypothetical protein